MLGLAKERGVMRAIVQTHHFQRLHAVTLQQIEGGRCLPEAPQLGQWPTRLASNTRLTASCATTSKVSSAPRPAQARSSAGHARSSTICNGFATWHQYRFGGILPGLQALRVTLGNFTGQQAFPLTMGNFQQTVIERQHRRAVFAQGQLRGAGGARQWRGNRTISRYILQALAERCGLR